MVLVVAENGKAMYSRPIVRICFPVALCRARRCPRGRYYIISTIRGNGIARVGCFVNVCWVGSKRFRKCWLILGITRGIKTARIWNGEGTKHFFDVSEYKLVFVCVLNPFLK